MSVLPFAVGVPKDDDTPCPGPAGAGWPCALTTFHGDDHVPLTREAVRALRAERDEYRRLLLMALPLLMDVNQARGAFLRSGVVRQIEAAVRS